MKDKKCTRSRVGRRGEGGAQETENNLRLLQVIFKKTRYKRIMHSIDNSFKRIIGTLEAYLHSAQWKNNNHCLKKKETESESWIYRINTIHWITVLYHLNHTYAGATYIDSLYNIIISEQATRAPGWRIEDIVIRMMKYKSDTKIYELGGYEG